MDRFYPHALVATYVLVALVATLDLFIWRP